MTHSSGNSHRGRGVRRVPLLAAAMLTLGTAAWAGNHWLSQAVTIEGEPVTLSRMFGLDGMPSTVTLFDIVISLHADPQGDNNPVTPDERTPYEDIIEHFADGVFEQTDGAHRLRRVRIFRNARFAQNADILWQEQGRPTTHVNGYGSQVWDMGQPVGLVRLPDQHIFMYDRIPGSVDFLDTQTEGGINGRVAAGRLLAHAWAHYTYGLLSEGNDVPLFELPPFFPRPVDDPVVPSIMNSPFRTDLDENDRPMSQPDYGWLNHSIPWTDPPGPFTDTRNTAQHRVYLASGWETLARRSFLDPPLPIQISQAQRIWWPDLATARPATGEEPSIDLPSADARRDLEIIWMEDTLIYQIVLDRSGSMSSSNKIENAKVAAMLLVELAEIGKTVVGVISFNQQQTVDSPLTFVGSQTDIDEIAARIEPIQAGGSTAMGLAAREALTGLQQIQGPSWNRVVFFLSDGKHNTDFDPLDLIPEFQEEGIPIMGFGYAAVPDQVDSRLRRMADETGGIYYYSPTQLGDIVQAFLDANHQVSNVTDLAAGSVTAPLGQLAQVPFPVDSTLGEVHVIVTHDGPPSSATILLIRPDGSSVPPESCVASGNETLCRFLADATPVGEWTLTGVDNGGGTLNMTYRMRGIPSGGLTYSASVINLTGTSVAYPDPVVLLATLDRGLPIAGAEVTGHVIHPSGTEVPLSLHDDGFAPDAVADDGIYSGQMPYSEDGIHQLQVTFSNPSGEATTTDYGLMPLPVPGGERALPQATPIAEPFVRTARLQIDIDRDVFDDHGNTPGTASWLPPDNIPLPGVIDYEDDADVFYLDVPAGLYTATFRVSDLGMGMVPHLRVLDSDGVTILGERTFDPEDPSVTHLFVHAPVRPGQRVYGEVTHALGSPEGTYLVSGGSPIDSERPMRLDALIPGNQELRITWLEPPSALDVATYAVALYDLGTDVEGYLPLGGSPDQPWRLVGTQREATVQVPGGGWYAVFAAAFYNNGQAEVSLPGLALVPGEGLPIGEPINFDARGSVLGIDDELGVLSAQWETQRGLSRTALLAWDERAADWVRRPEFIDGIFMPVERHQTEASYQGLMAGIYALRAYHIGWDGSISDSSQAAIDAGHPSGWYWLRVD